MGINVDESCVVLLRLLEIAWTHPRGGPEWQLGRIGNSKWLGWLRGSSSFLSLSLVGEGGKESRIQGEEKKKETQAHNHTQKAYVRNGYYRPGQGCFVAGKK